MRQIFLITLGLSTALFADFSKTGNIVTDSTTALQWQDNETITMTWTQAIDYCEGLSLDGYTDWRQPNLKELTSLVDDSKITPALNAVFEHTVSNNYWSSTSYAGYSSLAWAVNFDTGFHDRYTKTHSVDVRCVRTE